LRRPDSRGIKHAHPASTEDRRDQQTMPTTAQPSSTDIAVESHVFWLRFRKEILAVIIMALLAIIGFNGYRFYTDRREEQGANLLGGAKTISDYQKVIAAYGDTPAGQSAYLFLADRQRAEKKFAEANTTLQDFVTKNPEHELAPTARMAMAANLESMGKTDEALALYQQIATGYPTSASAPLALISKVHILKVKNRPDEAKQTCDLIINKYGNSTWAREAMMESRSLKTTTPSAEAKPGSQPGQVAPALLARPAVAAPAAAPTAKPK